MLYDKTKMTASTGSKKYTDINRFDTVHECDRQMDRQNRYSLYCVSTQCVGKQQFASHRSKPRTNI